MAQTFRDNGAIGALLDEYERAINDLLQVIDGITQANLRKIVDAHTDDPDCRSIQTILTHVVQSGYTYVIEIRKWKGEDINYRDKVTFDTISEYQSALKKMFQFNVSLFNDYPNLQLVEHDNAKKIHARWGQIFDPDQMLEHAIVHILRHRRQIERFVIKLN